MAIVKSFGGPQNTEFNGSGEKTLGWKHRFWIDYFLDSPFIYYLYNLLSHLTFLTLGLLLKEMDIIFATLISWD